MLLMFVVSLDVCFLLSEDGTKKMRVLSGGEKVRASLPHDDPGK